MIASCYACLTHCLDCPTKSIPFFLSFLLETLQPITNQSKKCPSLLKKQEETGSNLVHHFSRLSPNKSTKESIQLYTKESIQLPGIQLRLFKQY